MYQLFKHLENVIPPIGVGDLTPSPNVNMESENNSDTSRGSHVRNPEIDLREISGYTTSGKSNIK